MLRQVCLSISMLMSTKKNDITLSCGADKNNGDNFNVAVDTNILICRDFDEVNKILKEDVRNS